MHERLRRNNNLRKEQKAQTQKAISRAHGEQSRASHQPIAEVKSVHNSGLYSAVFPVLEGPVIRHPVPLLIDSSTFPSRSPSCRLTYVTVGVPLILNTSSDWRSI